MTATVDGIGTCLPLANPAHFRRRAEGSATLNHHSMAQSLTRVCAFKNTRISSRRIVYGQYSRIGHKGQRRSRCHNKHSWYHQSSRMSVAALPLDRQQQTAPS
jgi:hypothetical protein